MNKQSEFFDSREMPLPALFQAAGYDQNTRIAGLSDVDGPGAWNKVLERAAEMKAERDRTRRAEKEARDRASWEADQLIRPRPPPHRIQLIPRRGASATCVSSRLQRLTSYLDDMRPSQRFPRLLHTCPLCLELKSHPVKLLCEHSACYVCLRFLWRRTGAAPTCGREITRRPIPDDAEASAIERENSGWDDNQARLHNMEPKDGALPTTAERLKQARRDKAQELQQRRAAAAQATKAAEDAEAAALDVRLRHSRVEKIERMRFGPRTLPGPACQKTFASPSSSGGQSGCSVAASSAHSQEVFPPDNAAAPSALPPVCTTQHCGQFVNCAQISRRRDDYLDPDYSFTATTPLVDCLMFRAGTSAVVALRLWLFLAAQLTLEEEAELALKRAQDERREEDRNKDFLDAQSWPGPPVRRSAEEIARGREALYERLRAKELQRQAEGPKPPPRSPPRPADYYEKRHEERKKRIALKKARRDALQKLRDNPLKGPKLPPPLPTPTLGELKRRATAERDRRERMRVRDLRVSNFEALCAQMASRKRSRK
ncbi:hypothetical protein B0H14DRAFT_3449490 [Mycena olivaceomarginata]|nr:hypothetical protein B0H14DRAFT_3449490 [Mycena olivaceomarginata]